MPDGLEYVACRARFGLITADSVDDIDDDPDTRFLTGGTVTITPRVAAAQILNGVPVPFLAANFPTTCVIDSDGYMTLNDKRTVKVVDLTTSGISPLIPEGTNTHSIAFSGLVAGSDTVQFPNKDVRISADTAVDGVVDLVIQLPQAALAPTAPPIIINAGEVDPEAIEEAVEAYLAANPPAGGGGNDGEDGEDGVGIAGIALLSGNGAPGTIDTYRITLTDASTFDFSVQNGANGQDGQDGEDGEDGQDGTDGHSPYRGSWDSLGYQVNDIVEYSIAGNLLQWICTQAHSSPNAPSFTSEYWRAVNNLTAIPFVVDSLEDAPDGFPVDGFLVVRP